MLTEEVYGFILQIYAYMVKVIMISIDTHWKGNSYNSTPGRFNSTIAI